MSNIASYKGLGANNPVGEIITTADNTIGYEQAFKPLLIAGGTNGSTFLIPSTGLEVGIWFEFHILADAVTAATRFGAATSAVDVKFADTTGRFVVAGSTEEGSEVVRLTAISPSRYQATFSRSNTTLVATVVTT